MKNSIKYYYNLEPINIHQSNNYTSFTINNYYYILLPYERNVNDIDELIELSIGLYQKGIHVHQFILNNDKKVLTNINNKLYVLLLVIINNYDQKITINDLIYFNYYTQIEAKKSKILRHDWFDLWTKKIDYYEYQISQIGKKYPLIRESFSYFVGLSETSIMLVKNVNNIDKNKMKTISHNRIKYNDTFLEFYNPLNFIIDVKERDISEYFKSSLFTDENDINDMIIQYLNTVNMNETEIILFFSRLIFPNFYFDVYEKIIHENKEEKEILKIVNKIDKYENSLKHIYMYIKHKMNFPTIEWLEKT